VVRAQDYTTLYILSTIYRNKPMIKTESFPALFLVIYCPVAIIALALPFLFGSADYLKPVLWGSTISIFLIWSTVLVADNLLKTSLSGLLILVFGGIIFRFSVVIGSGLVVKFMTNMNLTNYFSGLLFSYVIMQLIEVIYFYKQFGKHNPDKK